MEVLVPKNCELLKCQLPVDFDVSSSECEVSKVKICSVNEIDNLKCLLQTTLAIYFPSPPQLLLSYRRITIVEAMFQALNFNTRLKTLHAYCE